MSKYKTKDIVMGWFFLIGFAATGFYIGRVTSEPSNVPVKQMIDGNSAMIHSLGVTAKMQSTNIGLIQEIMEEMKPEGERFDVKPAKTREKSLFELYSDFEPDSDVPTTYEQVMLDQQEIKLSIQSLGWGNIFMEESLRQILKKIKESHLTNQ